MSELKLSRIIHGQMRLDQWGVTGSELLDLIKELVELGITSFDHADIYGNYSCEKIFGEALKLDPSLRTNIQLISKCGIKLMSDKFPQRKIKHYDLSAPYIIESANQSLKNLNTDYLDVLLIHRPSPFYHPSEIAEAFEQLYISGKVRHFGVSNFNQAQIETLKKYCNQTLSFNQIEISPYCLDHFENGNIDYCLKEKIIPMAWSPLAGSTLLSPNDNKSHRIFNTLKALSKELSLESIDVLIYAWILNHPANIHPILGTGKIDRIRKAAEALKVELSLEQWFQIYTASTGQNVP